MKPVKTPRYDGIYGAPTGYEDRVGGLPYYREYVSNLDSNVIYSVWAFDEGEREAIAKGYNIIVGQVGEPIRAMSVGITHLKEEENVFPSKEIEDLVNNRPPKPPAPSKDREMG